MVRNTYTISITPITSHIQTPTGSLRKVYDLTHRSFQCNCFSHIWFYFRRLILCLRLLLFLWTLLLSMSLSFTFNCSSFNNSLFYCFIEIIFQNALLNISHWSKITYFTYKFIFSSEGAKLLHSFKSVTRNQISVCFLFNKDYYRIWMTWFFTTWCMWSHLFG